MIARLTREKEQNVVCWNRRIIISIQERLESVTTHVKSNYVRGKENNFIKRGYYV